MAAVQGGERRLIGKGEWLRVSKAMLCPVCERFTWCTISADGRVAKCTRVESAKPVKGGGWIHQLSEPLPVADLKPKPARKESPAEWTKRSETMFKRNCRGEMAALLGVSESSLELLGVGHGYDHDGRPFWSFPERDIRWQCVGINRRYADGSKKHMAGGTHGLYFEREWWTKRGPIFVPEGASDTAALLTMGLCAIGRPSNTGGIERLIGLLMDQRTRPIVILGERDEHPERRGQEKTKLSCPAKCKGCALCWPGLHGMTMTANALSKALKRQVYSRLVNGAKDVREWLCKNPVDGLIFVRSLKVPEKWVQSLKLES